MMLMGSATDRHTWRAAGDVLVTLGNGLLAGVAVYAAVLVLALVAAVWEPMIGAFISAGAPWCAVVTLALVCRARGRVLVERAERGHSID